ncbi:dihydrofolate reductase family protein [Zafaria sp. J156]|uniref:dihydrofolate reductase family protein n=1 Tax=Zafaria sp. J156 TaxID=3116490 RepID=UPI002E77BCE5|nr:dihydrofolate reductase family protein [Zafaria sp. J156]MEE1620331.1 dihydrofolate reductase family protein [Zafaria sp. J156]
MVRRIHPGTDAAQLTDAALLRAYAPPAQGGPFVRFNFVSTLDGAATHGGVSAELGTDADHRIFALLRRHADVILVGAGTIRAEGYEGPLLDEAGLAWRRRHHLEPHPGVAVVSGSLDLDPDSAFFTEAPVRPVLLTSRAAPARRRAALEAVADVVDCGAAAVDPAEAVAVLAERGHRVVHSEGGPGVFASFQAAGRVDSLCLSLSPLLAGGSARRIADGSDEQPLRRMDLVLALEEDGALFLEYRREHRKA